MFIDSALLLNHLVGVGSILIVSVILFLRL